MSRAVDVFDYLVARIPTVLTGYKRLSNPYRPEENADVLIKLGYGVKIGSAENLNSFLGCRLLEERRQFTIVLTQKYYAREDDGAKKAEAERALLNDSFSLKKDIETNPQFGGIASSAAFVSDSGIQFVFNEKDRFIFNEITVAAQYVEDLS